jgi:hypothetical protein
LRGGIIDHVLSTAWTSSGVTFRRSRHRARNFPSGGRNGIEQGSLSERRRPHPNDSGLDPGGARPGAIGRILHK